MSAIDLASLNARLQMQSAAQRIETILHELPGTHMASTSFGAQSAALLHLLQTVSPSMPIVFVDTGFLFQETHAFAEHLIAKLKLNIVRTKPDPKLQFSEAQVQALEHQELAALERYNQIHKVQPMQQALKNLGAQSWFSGLRRTQSESREQLSFVSKQQNGVYKIHPLADWTDRDIGRYLAAHDLPYHPLWEQGYVSIGDRYLTRAIEPGMRPEDTRFFGRKRECGLHEAAGFDVPVWALR